MDGIVDYSVCLRQVRSISCFFFNDTATTEIYTLSLHDALPICVSATDLTNPDFVALASAYGMHAERVDRTDQFAPAFERALASVTGALLHLVTTAEQLTPRLTVQGVRNSEGRE